MCMHLWLCSLVLIPILQVFEKKWGVLKEFAAPVKMGAYSHMFALTCSSKLYCIAASFVLKCVGDVGSCWPVFKANMHAHRGFMCFASSLLYSYMFPNSMAVASLCMLSTGSSLVVDFCGLWLCLPVCVSHWLLELSCNIYLPTCCHCF
jgi:hypothetical protein